MQMLPYRSTCGNLLPGVDVVVVQLTAPHAHFTVSTQMVSHGGSSTLAKKVGAWMRAASAAFWIVPTALSATPFSSDRTLCVGEFLLNTLLPAHVPEISTNGLPSVVRPWSFNLQQHTIRTHIGQALPKGVSGIGRTLEKVY